MRKYKTDYTLLKRKIIEKYKSVKNFVKALNWNLEFFEKRINNLENFSQDEIYAIIDELNINDMFIPVLFFRSKSSETQTKEEEEW